MAHRPHSIDASLSTPVLQPLPNLFSRNRSESRLVKSSSSAPNKLNQTTISQLRNRNRKSKLIVDPELAAAVVKSYLLPMFESQSKKIAAKSRAVKFGTEDKESRAVTSETVYADLKLTEKLMADIEALRNELGRYKQESMDAKQQLLSSEEESNQLKERYEQLETNYEFLSFQLSQQIKYLQKSESKNNLFLEQLHKYKALYNEAVSREEELNMSLHKERAENDKLQNNLTELYHMNDMVMMQNQIIGEKLRGLNAAFMQLVFKKSSEVILTEELEMLSKNTHKLCASYEEIEAKMYSNLNENITLWSDLKEMQSFKLELQEQLRTLTSKAKERFKYLSQEIKLVNLDKEKCQIELAQSLKANDSLKEEIDHLKSRLQHLRSRKNLTDNNSDLKICSNCKKDYKESENFNWSCKVHTSQYGSDYWWCCGKKGENSQGCRASKHESREEDAEGAEENPLLKMYFFCSACKSYGHNVANCPKDPNAKSGADYREELTRLQELKKGKGGNVIGAEAYQKMYEKLLNRGVLPFVEESVSGERSESEEGLDVFKQFFIDIMELKKDIDFSTCNVIGIQNLFNLKNEMTEEETLAKKKTIISKRIKGL